MVPEGWKKESLSDVAAVIDCKHRTPVYVEAGIPLVSPGTIKWGALDLISPVKRVGRDEYESLMDHCTVDIGDLVMSRNQSVGIASHVETDAPFVLGQDTVLIKPKKVDCKFVFYKLQSEVVQRSIIKLAGGSTFSRINLADIRKLKLDLPPLPEQKKIAQILSTWDKAITTTEQLLANSQQQKKALMQQLLTGKKRLLDENGERFRGEWKNVQVSDVCKIGRGRVISKIEIEANPGDYPVYSSQTLSNGVMGYLNTFDFEGEYVTWTTDGVNAGTVFYRTGKFNCTNVCGTLSAKDCLINLRFLSFALSIVAYKYVSHTLANPKLMNGVMASVNFNMPPLEEQQKIAAVLYAADEEISALQQKIEALKQEKKALMQQLLTGKRRVKIDEVAA